VHPPAGADQVELPEQRSVELANQRERVFDRAEDVMAADGKRKLVLWCISSESASVVLRFFSSESSSESAPDRGVPRAVGLLLGRQRPGLRGPGGLSIRCHG